MQRNSELAIVRNQKITTLYREGKTLQSISNELNVPIGTVGDVVCRLGVANRRPKLNDHQKATICQMLEGYTISEVALKAHCSRTIAHKYLHWYRRRIEQRLRDSGASMPLNRPKLCPKHGKIVLWPCVACRAEESLNSRNRVDGLSQPGGDHVSVATN